MPSRCCSPSDSIRFQCASSSSRSASAGRPTASTASRDARSHRRCRARPDSDGRAPAWRSGNRAAAAAPSACASVGTAIVPVPNGQMPAMARNSVDLPEPDGPVTSTLLAAARCAMPSAATSGVPFGSRDREIVERDRLAASPARPRSTGGVVAAACALRDRGVEAGQPLDHRAPFRELRDRRRRRTTARSARCRRRDAVCVSAAELDRAGEIGRADHDERETRSRPARSPR